jgi:hypothetical protein
MYPSARWCCGLRQAREKDTPNQALQQTAAAMLVPRASRSHSATAAAEFGVPAARFDRIDEWHVYFRNMLSYNTLWRIPRFINKYTIICLSMIGRGTLEKMASDVT